MIYLDVDATVTVPVNAMPLTDDTDYKTRETGVAHNAAGMDLVWNFVTPAGVITQTAVIPTTGGAYDWSHTGDGMYQVEIPASGGGSINNDTEGVGYFSGVCDGVLPWRGPDIVFRAAALNDALIESPWSTARGLAGTALPNAAADAAGGLPISDAGGLDLDARLDAAITSRAVAGDAMTLTAAYDPAKTASQAGDQMTLTVGAITSATFASGAITASAIAANAIGATELSDAAVAKIEAALLNEGDGQALIDAIVQAIDAADIDASLVSTMTRDAILNRVLPGNHDVANTVGSFLQELDAAISTRSSHAASAVVTALKGDAEWSDLSTLQTDVTALSGLITGLDDLSAAEVQAACDAALVARHLDHLLGVAYDPASKPGVATSLMNVIFEDDGGVPRLTGNVLELAPAGTNGGATAEEVRVEMDANSVSLGGIKTVTDQFRFTVANQVDANALSGGGSGSGSRPCKITVKDEGGGLVPNAPVTILNSAGDAIIAAGNADSSGEVQFNLNDLTYRGLVGQMAGFATHVAESFTVSAGNSDHELTVTHVPIAVPDGVGLCAVICVVKTGSERIYDALARAKLVGGSQMANGIMQDGDYIDRKTNSRGIVVFQLVQMDQFDAGDGRYRITAEYGGETLIDVTTKIPNEPSVYLDELIANPIL